MAAAVEKPAKKRRLSPVARRRWSVFRSQKRAVWSAIFLMIAVFICLFAELLCNHRPLLVKYEGEFYTPVFQVYPETMFGGIFETEADYTDEFVLEQITTNGNWAIFAPIRFDYAFVDTSLQAPAPSPPDSEHVLGTDDRGRDVAARLIYGFRLSILFAFSLAIFGSILGILAGAIQGYVGGKFDLVCQRLTEVWSSQNELYLLIILSSVFTQSISTIFILMSLFGWMGLAAYVRAEFLRARNYDFVEAAIAMGSRRPRVMWQHILPNTLTPVITFFPFRVSGAVTALTALDFLGLGVPSPTPSLGELLAQGKANLTSWWIIFSVIAILFFTLVLLNFIGEGVQKAMDPKVVA